MIVVRYFILLMFLSPPVTAQEDLQKGLLACYSFSGNASDGSGNNYHGTAQGPMLVSDRYGNTGSAYLFDGKDDHIVIPAEPFRNINYTYAMWINVSVFPPDSTGAILSFGNELGKYHGVEVNNSNNYPDNAEYAINFNGYVAENSAITQVIWIKSTRQWHHVVAERTDTHVKIYHDGILKLSSTINLDGSPSPALYGDPLIAFIGMRCTSDYPFYGIIDDIAIYNRAISDQEVLKLYHEGLPCSSGPLIPIPTVANVKQCGAGTAVLTATGGLEYKWYDEEEGGNLLFVGNPLVIPHVSETVSCYVSNVTENGESARRKVTVTVSPLPELTCNFPFFIFTGDLEHYQVNANAGTPSYHYDFNFGDGTLISTSENIQQHTYLSDGLHTILVTVTDATGCNAECTATVESTGEDVFIPNIITPNSDLHNEIFTLYIKVGDNYLPYPERKIFTMHIYNRWGTEIFSSTRSSDGWSGRSAATGVYYYSIIAGHHTFKGVVTVLK